MQAFVRDSVFQWLWVPACAGMTVEKFNRDFPATLPILA